MCGFGTCTSPLAAIGNKELTSLDFVGVSAHTVRGVATLAALRWIPRERLSEEPRLASPLMSCPKALRMRNPYRKTTSLEYKVGRSGLDGGRQYISQDGLERWMDLPVQVYASPTWARHFTPQY